MKLTQRQLKKMIKEELRKVRSETQDQSSPEPKIYIVFKKEKGDDWLAGYPIEGYLNEDLANERAEALGREPDEFEYEVEFYPLKG